MEADEKESRSDGGWDWLDEDEEQEQKPDRIPKRIEAEAGNDYDDEEVDEDDDFDAWGHNDSNSDRGSMDRARSRDGFISRQTIGVA